MSVTGVFIVFALLLLSGLMALLFWWHLYGPAYTALGAILALCVALIEGESR